MTAPSRRHGPLVAACALALLGASFTVPALARPGGGQNFRAPTRSSSSSSSSRGSYSSRPTYTGGTYTSSSSSGDGCSGAGMAIFFVMVIVVIVLIVVANRSRKRAGVAVDRAAQERGLAALRAQDPAFDPAALCQRARLTMNKLNEAWSKGNLGPVRRLLSDGVYVRMNTQLALLRAEGVRNVMADWQALGAEIVAAESDANWDAVHVKLVGQARDCDVPADMPPDMAARKVAGASLSQYQEVWSLLRRRGAKTKGQLALEGRCPNCGADMPLGDVVRCEYCRALVNSGEHDWVLAEITQPEEWRPASADQLVPGLAELRQRDAHLSRQEVEDRASVIFWKWIEAQATGQRKKLDRFTVQPGDPSLLPLLPPGGRRRLAKVAVGSVEVKGIYAATQQGMPDRITLEITWSGSIEGAAPAGRFLYMTLGRAPGIISRRTLSALDCPTCAGPLGDSDAIQCGYCGSPLAGGQHEWALLAVRETTTAIAA